jgi:membrane protein implicated in regulation of membrane protease activity
MTRLRTRRSFVFLAVGLVLFAAFVPAVAASLPVAILAPLWLILPTVAITLIRREASRCDDQPTSLLALVASRAPPSTLALP